MDVPDLLRHAADVVPADERSDADLGANDVREYLRHHEWEVALGILEDFDGIRWQTVRFWDLLIEAAQQMWLADDVTWLHWRRSETLHGLIRADLQLAAPDAGGRRSPIPGKGQLRPLWSIGRTAAESHDELHIARIRVESAPEIPPGGRGPIRLLPLTPSHWRHLEPGDTVTMHERNPVAATATITQIEHPPH
ncbi:hypothetical protein [Actinomadura sp. 7K507]|uniref:hypothetical protein n=1 Tax=Actinomadura sp. 7K507 TaxID=2530365 RepID=UPI001A9E2108|nr:hypothetical protein [Actinomadura sp. 7K507]